MEWMLMPLKRYAEFRGRSRRQEFWMWQLLKVLVGVVFMVVMAVAVGGSIMSMASGSGNVGAGAAVGMGVGLLLYLVMLVFGLAIIVPDIAVAVRRLHDTDRSGLWLLIGVVPYFVGYVLTFAGMASQSTAIAGVGGLIVLAGFIGAIVLLVFMCLPGTVGPNRYGADPKEDERAAVAMAPPAY